MSGTRREKVTGRVLALDRALEDTLPYLFGLLGIVEGRRSAGADGPADQAAADARGDQAHLPAREPQSAGRGDLRRPALDRRRRPRHLLDLLADSVANPRGAAARQLSSRVLDTSGPARAYYTQLRLHRWPGGR